MRYPAAMMRFGLGLLVCVVACGGDARECSNKVAGMRAVFAQAELDPVVINTPAGMQLSTTGVGGSIGDGIPLFIQADGSYVFGVDTHATYAALKEPLAEEFAKAIQLAENMGRPYRGHVIVVADLRAPARAVLEVVADLPPGTSVGLVADLDGDTVPTAPPSTPAVEAALAGPADQRSRAIAEVLETAIGSCAPLKDAFAGVAQTTADDRTRFLLDALPPAVEKCNCVGVDVETLVAAVWGMTGKTAPEKRQLALNIVTDPSAEAVELPAAATSQDLIKLAETRGDQPVRVTLKP